MYSPETTKYLIHLTMTAEGVVEKPDVVGAIFGQTEGLLGEDLDLRDLQRTGRVGRIDVQVSSKKGETKGEILILSSLDRAETALLAASFETIDRVGPCSARVSVDRIEDIRVTKRRKITERARELLLESFDEGTIDSYVLLDEVREAIRMEKVEMLGDEKVPAGPHVMDSDAIIVVEGRADVINLLRYGIKNSVAVEGTNVPDIIIQLCDKKTATAFLDGDRGGDLILRELLQVADIDYVAISPKGKSVEEMSRKEIIKALRNKVPAEFSTQTPREEGGGRVPRPSGGTRGAARESSGTQEAGRKETPVKKQSDPAGQVQRSLEEHIVEVEGQHIARFLSAENAIILESNASELENALKSLDEQVAGVVIDRVIDQKALDLVAASGLKFIVAPEYRGIAKRPLSIERKKFV